MRRIWLAALVFVAAACGSGGGGSGQGLGDDHLSLSCKTKLDCDDNDPCTTDGCGADQMCEFSPINCDTQKDSCNVGACEAGTGKCIKMPANEGADCLTDPDSQPGTCKGGTCAAIPQCPLSSTYPDSCRYGSESDDTSSSYTSAMPVLDTYACAGATNETGPELAYLFAADRDGPLTVTLKSTVDLDLIILEGDKCVQKATCAAAGLTRGSGNETVTFNAKAGTTYTVVVDGYNGAKGSFTLDFQCQKICDTTKATLTCGQTVTGNLASSSTKSATPSTVCSGVMDTGPADVYLINPPSTTTTKNYTVTLSGLAQDLDLQVIESYSTTLTKADCDYYCYSSSATMSGTSNESATFYGYSGQPYYVLVGAKTTGGAYTLSVTCQ